MKGIDKTSMISVLFGLILGFIFLDVIGGIYIKGIVVLILAIIGVFVNILMKDKSQQNEVKLNDYNKYKRT